MKYENDRAGKHVDPLQPCKYKADVERKIAVEKDQKKRWGWSEFV